MANKEHVALLEQGVKAWNAWRRSTRQKPDLSNLALVNAKLKGANLSRANLTRVKFGNADLSSANLVSADLSQAALNMVNLEKANLSNAWLLETDLSYSILNRANLKGAHLLDTNLYAAVLTGTTLTYAEIAHADMTSANLAHADLGGTHIRLSDLWGADLTKANLSGTSLYYTILCRTNLRSVDVTGAYLDRVFFSDVDLSEAIGLESCVHHGPSSVDHMTLQKSGNLPLSFLRGVGFSDRMIEYIPSIFNNAIQFYSCFISYATRDQDFADRLHADLQHNGVRCWFAPHDMPVGGKILDEIDAAIRVRDKVMLILSEHSIASDWVEDEVTRAFEEERKRGQIVLFPVRLDDAVMDSNEAWVSKLRARHIGDFTDWESNGAYRKSFERILRDLKVQDRAGR